MKIKTSKLAQPQLHGPAGPLGGRSRPGPVGQLLLFHGLAAWSHLAQHAPPPSVWPSMPCRRRLAHTAHADGVWPSWPCLTWPRKPMRQPYKGVAVRVGNPNRLLPQLRSAARATPPTFSSAHQPPPPRAGRLAYRSGAGSASQTRSDGPRAASPRRRWFSTMSPSIYHRRSSPAQIR
jgi:hypothetical protein